LDGESEGESGDKSKAKKCGWPEVGVAVFGRRVRAIEIFAPAKLNLFLAITGRRADGFHDLVSVAATLDFGDTLRADVRERGEGGGEWTLHCDDATVPTDETNLVVKAARAFAAATGWPGKGMGVDFSLTKRVPMGAGLGGGSSDAVAALRALNALSGLALGAAELATMAAGLGSDCALFLHDGPVVMRGRGERIEALPAGASTRLRGRRVLVFKPGFGIATPWAYGRMAGKAPSGYLPEAEAEARLAAWVGGDGAAETLLFNNMEPVAFEKFVALPTLLEQLRDEFGLVARMSGSGSACFALLPDGIDAAAIGQTVRAAWGPTSFVVEAKLR
jgi:4-diphosphocytidyl-2-C-methyl-D-erythritol kinase